MGGSKASFGREYIYYAKQANSALKQAKLGLGRKHSFFLGEIEDLFWAEAKLDLGREYIYYAKQANSALKQAKLDLGRGV